MRLNVLACTPAPICRLLPPRPSIATRARSRRRNHQRAGGEDDISQREPHDLFAEGVDEGGNPSRTEGGQIV